MSFWTGAYIIFTLCVITFVVLDIRRDIKRLREEISSLKEKLGKD